MQEGRLANRRSRPFAPRPGSIDHRQSTIVNYGRPAQSARTAGADAVGPRGPRLVETFLLSHMVGEEWQREEQELAAWQRERQKRETLEQGLEQMVAAQQELESQNRRLRA